MACSGLVKALEQDEGFRAEVESFVLVRCDVDDLPAKQRPGMYVTINCGYLLVLGPGGHERERLIIRGNDPKRTPEEAQRHFSVAAVRLAIQRGAADGAKGRQDLELLTHLLGHPDPRVRVDAAGQVKARHAEDAPTLLPALLPNLTQTDWHPWLGRSTAWALGKLGPASASALPEMLALLASKQIQPGLARSLLEVLPLIDPEGHQILATLRHNLTRREPRMAGALRAAKGLGPRAAPLVPEIEKALVGAPRRYLQVSAAQTLMAIGEDAAGALPALRRLAGDAAAAKQHDAEDVPVAAANAVTVIEAALAESDK